MRYLSLLFAALVIWSLGCSSTPRRGASTISRDPIKAVDVEAQRQFDAAVADLEAGRYTKAAEAFRIVQAEYPADPIAEVAELYLARADLADWTDVASQPTLSVLAGLADDPKIDTRIRHAAGVYFAASTMNARQAALKRLQNYPGPSLSPAILKRDRLMAWSVVAEALALAGRYPDAVSSLAHGFVEKGDHQEAESFRSYARARGFGLAEKLDLDVLAEFSTAPRSQFLRAVAGYELIRRNGPDELTPRVRGELFAIGAEQKALALTQADTPTGPPSIAVVLPLSGSNAGIGKRALNAAMLAVGAMGEREGYTTLVVVDANESIDVITSRLASVNAFVGPLDQGKAAELATWANANKIVMIAPVTQLPEPFEMPWAFRNFLDAEAEPRAAAQAALDTGLRRAAVIYPNIAYGQRLATTFVQAFTEGGGEVVVESEYDRSMSDYTKIAKRVAAAQPQAIFIPDSDAKVAEVTAFLANANIWGRAPEITSKRGGRHHVLYLGTSLWQRPDLLRRAGTYVEGAVIPAWSSPAFTDADSASFFREYIASFNEQPGDIEAFVYDSVNLLKLNLESRGLTNSAALRAALSGQEAFAGVTGSGRFNEQGEPIRQPRMVTVKKATFVPYSRSVVDPVTP